MMFILSTEIEEFNFKSIENFIIKKLNSSEPKLLKIQLKFLSLGILIKRNEFNISVMPNEQ